MGTLVRMGEPGADGELIGHVHCEWRAESRHNSPVCVASPVRSERFARQRRFSVEKACATLERGHRLDIPVGLERGRERGPSNSGEDREGEGAGALSFGVARTGQEQD